MKKRTVNALAMAMAMATTTVAGAATALPVMAEGMARDAGDRMVQNGMVDFGQGSASIKIQGNMDQSLVGKRFEVFRLFNAENSKDGESITYTFNNDYATALKTVVAKGLNEKNGSQLKVEDITEYMVIDYIQSLNTNKVEGAQTTQTLEGRYSQFRYFVEQVRDQIKASGGKGELVYVNSADSQNAIRMTGLQYGYYVVDEISTHDSEDNDYYASSLCMVNTANPTATVNIKSDYPQIIKKIKEDDNKDAVGTDGWNDIADYEIGQTVPYKFESTICDMNGYESYYYAWHDQMDEELTFHNNKKEIGITIKQGAKSYKLKDTEYNIITDAAQMDEGDTFKIEVKDIKAIIDKNFTDKIDAKGHNDYSGMTVTLTYNATLNEKAADKTGRPGFENDVRLEFSNDADSAGKGETGNTPWDTVVCFTYKINGLKVNDHDKVLKDAKFRLYSDKELKNEVFVKAKEDGNGYVVINRDKVGGTDHTGGTAPEDATEMSSNDKGEFIIHGLDQGTYYLKETDAPDGYRPLLDAIVVTVTPTFTAERNDYVAGQGATEETLKELKATAHVKEFYNGAFKEDDTVLNTNVEDGSADIKIVNKVGSKLPITGSSATLIMMGAGLALAGGAVVISRKNKKIGE